MKFATESGSTYEVDPDNSLIRRLTGDHAPTPRQGNDCEWKSYYWISEVKAHWPLFILWDEAGHSTVTSFITRVEE